MHKLLLLALVGGLCLISGAAWAQVQHIPQRFSSPIWDGPVDTTGLLSEQIKSAFNIEAGFRSSLIDNPPRFKGGEAALRRFLRVNLRFPSLLLRSNVEGWTKIQFIVGVDGRIRNVVVYKSLCQPWDDEVLRVVKLLDYRFEPATYNGELVAGSYVLSVPFSTNLPVPFSMK